MLRMNVYRPPGEGRFRVLLSAHPYGKDNLPTQTALGYRVSIQYRVLRQTGPVTFSTLTGWEAPDPVWWTERGYAVVNCDLRGAGTSETNTTRSWHVAINEMGRGRSKAPAIRGSYCTS